MHVCAQYVGAMTVVWGLAGDGEPLEATAREAEAGQGTARGQPGADQDVQGSAQGACLQDASAKRGNVRRADDEHRREPACALRACALTSGCWSASSGCWNALVCACAVL